MTLNDRIDHIRHIIWEVEPDLAFDVTDMLLEDAIEVLGKGMSHAAIASTLVDAYREQLEDAHAAIAAALVGAYRSDK